MHSNSADCFPPFTQRNSQGILQTQMKHEAAPIQTTENATSLCTSLKPRRTADPQNRAPPKPGMIRSSGCQDAMASYLKVVRFLDFVHHLPFLTLNPLDPITGRQREVCIVRCWRSEPVDYPKAGSVMVSGSKACCNCNTFMERERPVVARIPMQRSGEFSCHKPQGDMLHIRPPLKAPHVTFTSCT